ncbi:MAG: preprotein translocase subunit YajC [Salinibacter sp.]
MLSSSVATLFPVFLLQSSGDAGGGGLFGLFLPLLLIFAVFYFFIYRPQQKRQQEHEEMIENLEQGDKIVTVGGIHGTIQKIEDDSLLAQVDSKGTRLRFDKDSISRTVGDDNDE